MHHLKSSPSIFQWLEEHSAQVFSLLGRSSLVPVQFLYYQGLHIDLERLEEGTFCILDLSSPSKEMWLCSASVSSRSEQVSSLEEGEVGLGRLKAPGNTPGTWASPSLLGHWEMEGSDKTSTIRSWKLPSFSGIDSSR